MASRRPGSGSPAITRPGRPRQSGIPVAAGRRRARAPCPSNPAPAIIPPRDTRRARREAMPNITIQWYAGRTEQQKRQIVAVITDAMVKIGKTTPDQVHIVFQDVEKP